MLKNIVITLTSDFGLKDPFAGLMKGVILGINPAAKTVDITHNIERHNILEASHVISKSYDYFPPQSIHIVVVDPGVGSFRRPILVTTENHFFIGPDNGVFTSVLDELEPASFKVIQLTSSEFFLPMRGSTFHGRDIFAPVAAWLSKGTDVRKFGDEIEDYSRISIAESVLSDNKLTGTIVSIDNFGNCISNIKTDDLVQLSQNKNIRNFKIICNGNQLSLVNYYAENESSYLAALINSFGQLEIFIYKKSARDEYDIKIGDSVTVTLP